MISDVSVNVNLNQLTWSRVALLKSGDFSNVQL